MRILTLDSNKVIISIKNVGESYVHKENEIESNLGNLGQKMQADGSFITPEPEPIEPQPTLEDKINYIYYKEMGLIQ